MALVHRTRPSARSLVRTASLEAPGAFRTVSTLTRGACTQQTGGPKYGVGWWLLLKTPFPAAGRRGPHVDPSGPMRIYQPTETPVDCFDRHQRRPMLPAPGMSWMGQFVKHRIEEGICPGALQLLSRPWSLPML